MMKSDNVINFEAYKNKIKTDEKIDSYQEETSLILMEIVEILSEFGYDVSQNPKTIKDLIFMVDLIDSIKCKLNKAGVTELSYIIEESISLTDDECQELMDFLIGD